MLNTLISPEYKVREFEHDGYIYVQINKGMYGLAQPGLLENDPLAKQLAKHGFTPSQHTPGLWKHRSKTIQFTLVVDDFGVKYDGNQEANYLIKVLWEHYEALSVDWECEIFCSIKLDLDYKKRTVNLIMSGYMAKVLQRFLHPIPKIPEHHPHQHFQPQYATKV